jgi:virginiamycin A acetyltransferase
VADADRAPELRRSPLAAAVAARAPRGRAERLALELALRLEGGAFRSATARELVARHGVEVGPYSYGACLRLGGLPSGVTVGRYVSMATQVGVFRRNHPTERLSMHPAFYNPAVGLLDDDDLPSAPLVIGHDAWVAHQAVVLPGCTRIGIGAVVGAGAVVTDDVPDFAIVTGNPARVRRLRFPDDVCAAVLDSRWWELPVERLLARLPAMREPLGAGWASHPLLVARAA